MFGHLGVVLHDVDGKLQCHLCGDYYIHLGSHLKSHHITPGDYREMFGLIRHQPLASYEYCQSRRPIALRNQVQGKFPSGEQGKVFLEIERRKGCNMYTRRLQERLTHSEMMQSNNPVLSEEVRQKISVSMRKNGKT